MNARFYIDPETNLPHILGHGVTEQEVLEVLECPGRTVPVMKVAVWRLAKQLRVDI